TKSTAGAASRPGTLPPRAAVGTVWTVRKDRGRERHLTVADAGKVREVASYEEGFDALPREPQPTRTLTMFGGQVVPAPRWALCWGPVETYAPLTAGQLASRRQSREHNRAEPEARRWAEENPRRLNSTPGKGLGPRPWGRLATRPTAGASPSQPTDA